MATLRKKVGIAGRALVTANQSEFNTGITQAELYNFASSLPILQGIYPRHRTGSQLIALGMKDYKGQKIKPNSKYIMSREEVSREFHLNKLLLLSKNPEFGAKMLKDYKKAVQEDYTRGIKVKF